MAGYNVCFFIVAVLIALDVLVSTVYDFSEPLLSQSFGFVLFVLILCLVFGISTYYILPLTNRINRKIIEKSKLFSLFCRLIMITQIVLIIFFIIIISEILFLGYLHVILKSIVITTSSVLGGTVLAALGYKLLSWYNIDRTHSKIVLFYSLAVILTSFSVGINGAIVFNGIILSGQALTEPNSNISFPVLTYEQYGDLVPMFTITFLIYISAYSFIWLGTVILFYYHTKSYGKHKKKIWIFSLASLLSYIIAVLPTLAFLPTNQFIFDDQTLFFFRVLFKVSVILSGIFFGVIFILISRSFRKVERKGVIDSHKISNYAKLCGYGIVILTTITVSQSYNTTYPPFGLISSSFTAFTTYVIALGFYSMAISISSDYATRRIIENEIKGADLLGKIGKAEMLTDLENRVTELSKKNQEYLNEVTGVESNLSEENAKLYLNQVLQEIKSVKGDHK